MATLRTGVRRRRGGLRREVLDPGPRLAPGPGEPAAAATASAGTARMAASTASTAVRRRGGAMPRAAASWACATWTTSWTSGVARRSPLCSRCAAWSRPVDSA